MSETNTNVRDRLGLWGTGPNDSEVAGNVSGLERLRLSRFNKVRGNLIYLKRWFMHVNSDTLVRRAMRFQCVVYRRFPLNKNRFQCNAEPKKLGGECDGPRLK